MLKNRQINIRTHLTKKHPPQNTKNKTQAKKKKNENL